jgi:hypothetical protein
MDKEQPASRARIHAERLAAQENFLKYQSEMFVRIRETARGKKPATPPSEDLDGHILARQHDF